MTSEATVFVVCRGTNPGEEFSALQHKKQRSNRDVKWVRGEELVKA